MFAALREAGGGGGGRVYHQYNICMLCLQHLEKQEEAAGGVCITKPLPLRMSNEKAWQVILVSADVPHWPYRIHDGEKLKVSAPICVPGRILFFCEKMAVIISFKSKEYDLFSLKWILDVCD